MDPNLLHWKNEGKSFFSRLRIWLEVLDPSHLFSSDAEIQNARAVFISGEIQRERDEHAWSLSMSSVHADSGAVLPIVFRPPALLPISAPLVVASLLPHVGAKPALFWQFLLHSYSAGFNYANRNSSAEKGMETSLKQVLLVVGTVTYATCAGAIPQVVTNRLGIISSPFKVFLRSIVPIPLSAALAAFNVFIVRNEECQNGIRVFDSNGNTVGISKAAGEKAVRDTALSRATLMGTTAALPNILLFLLKKTRGFQKNPMLMTPMRHVSTALILGMMIPVSFSLFPQLGTIKKENLEKDLQSAAAADGQLFYHRGL